MDRYKTGVFMSQSKSCLGFWGKVSQDTQLTSWSVKTA
jgi:hypothetical protein